MMLCDCGVMLCDCCVLRLVQTENPNKGVMRMTKQNPRVRKPLMHAGFTLSKIGCKESMSRIWLPATFVRVLGKAKALERSSGSLLQSTLFSNPTQYCVVPSEQFMGTSLSIPDIELGRAVAAALAALFARLVMLGRAVAASPPTLCIPLRNGWMISFPRKEPTWDTARFVSGILSKSNFYSQRCQRQVGSEVRGSCHLECYYPGPFVISVV
jgi:hypothetical protein